MYKIKLPNFEGPFDLLLYFIKRDELNIYDIPISRITEEFLNYIRLIQFFDLELAGEFLIMASTLMMIKAQMLLPKAENADDYEIEDPRQQLVQRLIEYKQFKNSASELYGFYENQRYIYYRQIFEQDIKKPLNGNGNDYNNSTLFDLLRAFKKALDRIEKKEKQHIVDLIPVSIEEKITYILNLLKQKKRFIFFDIVKNQSKRHIIVTFLALLELIKIREVFIKQSDIFDDIVISANRKKVNCEL